ncbi:hypothetical protein [Mycobacterium sp. URHB0021]
MALSDGLQVVGLVLSIAPWIGGYAGDGAAWVSWFGGVALMLLTGAAYIADEAGAVTATERIKALAKYQSQLANPSDPVPTAAIASIGPAEIDARRGFDDALPVRPGHGADY